MSNGKLVTIIEWNVNHKNEFEISQAQKVFSSIEQEFNYLIKFRHQNIARYLSLRFEYIDSANTVIQLLREFIIGKSANLNYCFFGFKINDMW